MNIVAEKEAKMREDELLRALLILSRIIHDLEARGVILNKSEERRWKEATKIHVTMLNGRNRQREMENKI